MIRFGYRSILGTVPFKLSDIGEGIKEVVVKEWYVKVGDSVIQFDPICEVQSDKATVTITSRYDGVISALHMGLQDICAVGQALVDIEVEGGESQLLAEESSTEQIPVKDSNAHNMPTSEQVYLEKALATPSVRRLASENKVDLNTVTATGKGGRVIKEDILAFLNKAPIQSSTAHAPPPRTTTIPRPLVASTQDDRDVPLTVVQRAMKATMTISNQIPHFVVSEELDLTRLVQVRKETSKWVLNRYGMKVTYLAFLIKAASSALLDFPMLNAFTDENCNKLIYKAAHNIGVAIDTPDGLIVPNIKSVEHLSVMAIAAEIKRLQELGLQGKLGPAELSGGTITLSNIGSIAGTYTAPRLLPPQVMIAGLGRLQRLPRFAEDGSICEKHIMNVSWAADHRVIDGATVARFTQVWAGFLENPEYLLFELK